MAATPRKRATPAVSTDAPLVDEPPADAPLDESERAELEALRARYAQDGEPGEPTRPEGDICPIHHPNGWPEGADGATCGHGVFWRYGAPSGRPAAPFTVENWTDDEDLIL